MSKDPNEGKPSILRESTLIPISLVIAIVAGVIRVETTSFKANANEKDIDSIKITQTQTSKDISDIKTSIARIEGYMNSKAQSEHSPDKK